MKYSTVKSMIPVTLQNKCGDLIRRRDIYLFFKTVLMAIKYNTSIYYLHTRHCGGFYYSQLQKALKIRKS